MKSRYLAAVASVAFIAAGVAAQAQEQPKSDHRPAAQAAEPKAGGAMKEQGAAKAAQAEPRRDEMKGGAQGANPAARAEGERNEMKGGQGAEHSRAAEAPGQQERKSVQGEKEQGKAAPGQQERKSVQGEKEPMRAGEGKRAAEPNGEKSPAARTGANEPQHNGARTAERNEGRGPARVQGNVKMSSEHATRVSETLRREGRRENVNIHVRVGARVPESVAIRPLPADIIAIVPEYRGYDYFIDENDEIVFVAPQTHEVVGMIGYEGRAASDDNYTNVRSARPCPPED